MVRVVGVHGIGQQRETSSTLTQSWAPALVGGVRLADGFLDEGDVLVAAYGDLFRPPGRKLAVGDAPLRPADLDEFEQQLLRSWWEEAARVDRAVVSPDARTLARTPGGIQAALRALSNSKFFAAVTTRAMLGDLRQVREYLQNPQIRDAARERVAAAVASDTIVLVGHSLGTVVAYEALCANPQWPITTFVTLGSPLGIKNLIFDRLEPAPALSGKTAKLGQWPAGITRWSNIADRADVVALVKDLSGPFGSGVNTWTIDNGAKAHKIEPYLTARETGAAIAAGLSR